MTNSNVIPPLPTSDDLLFAQMRTQLFSAVIGDILDKMGFLRQFLPQAIKPVAPHMVIIGRAMPVLEADCFADTGQTELLRKPFGCMFEALDDLKKNEIYITTGSSLDYALWGGLMTTRARTLAAAGAILDGYHRDTSEILERDWPVFSRGSYAQDQAPRGKVIDWRVPIEIEGVRIHPGDILFGDRDGVLVIPQSVEREAIEKALVKAHTENQVRVAIENGMSTVQAFATFGVM